MNISNNMAIEKENFKSSRIDSICAYSSILKYNCKLLFNLNFVAAIAYVILVLMVSSIKLLDYKTLATIGELYISIIGIILIPYISSFEDKDNIKEVIYSRKVAYVKVILCRIVIVMLFMFLIITSIMLLAKIQGCSFEFMEITFGTWISAAFLGMIGFTVANLFHNISAAYLICFSYYFMEYVTKGKYTKDLYLFSLTKGSLTTGKYELLLITLIIIFVNLYIVKRES